jgi:hypothetical protein
MLAAVVFVDFCACLLHVHKQGRSQKNWYREAYDTVIHKSICDTRYNFSILSSQFLYYTSGNARATHTCLENSYINKRIAILDL